VIGYSITQPCTTQPLTGTAGVPPAATTAGVPPAATTAGVREARAVHLELTLLRLSRRDACGPTELLEWFAAMFAKPGAAEGPVARFRAQAGLHRIVFYVFDSIPKVFCVANIAVEVFRHPKLTGAV
jgi:hypothetical protein